MKKSENKALCREILSDDLLKERIRMLTDIIDACKACMEGGISWNKACLERGLAPLNTRRMLLRLDKCASSGMAPIEAVDAIEVYDGYIEFYKAVFGSCAVNHMALPLDYEESVAHVIKNTGLTDRESLVLMRRFGIIDYGIPESGRDIAPDLGVTYGYIYRVEKTAIKKCRCRKRYDILSIGLKKYGMMQQQAREKQKKSLELANIEHGAMLRKQEREHEERMQIIQENGYEKAAMLLIPDDIESILKSTSIDVLGLSTRARNALTRSRVKDLYSLLDIICNKGGLMKIRNMGALSAADVMVSLDKYMTTRWGIGMNTMYTVCLRNDIFKR